MIYEYLIFESLTRFKLKIPVNVASVREFWVSDRISKLGKRTSGNSLTELILGEKTIYI